MFLQKKKKTKICEKLLKQIKYGNLKWILYSKLSI